jgi:conjugative relaxase-like TrwC/TraI family protein
MLSIGAMGGGQAGYYLSLAREDYYLEGGEPQGRWLGEAAESLGLPELVTPAHLYNLFDGLDPDGTRPLGQMQRHADKQEHRPGWDLTFSAPKAVSALWSQLAEDERTLIQEAHYDAVKTALEFLEDKAVLTRRGKGGSADGKGQGSLCHL